MSATCHMPPGSSYPGSCRLSDRHVIMTIDEETTFKEKGYRSTDLSKGSDKKIFAVCDGCGKGRWLTLYNYRDFCKSCCRAGDRSPLLKPKITKTCKQCGKKYEVVPSVAKYSKFCSIKCKAEWRSKNVRGENSWCWKPKVVKICKYCGKEYEVIPSKEATNRFCSRECSGKWRSEHYIGENSPTWNGGNILKTCMQCGKEYSIRPSRKDASNFCSKECQILYQHGENSSNWKGGTSFEPYCPKFSKTFREGIREKFGRVCFLCGKTEKENGKKLSVHHVSYDKHCMCDGIECEFVPLCSSCHSKTNFNRDLWEQHFTYLLAERGLLQHQKQSTLQQHGQEQQTTAFS